MTNNRCERGEILGNPQDAGVRARLQQINQAQRPADLLALRRKLLFQPYPHPNLCAARGITIGLPRVLFFWDTMPFWQTFFSALGFTVQLSDFSTRKMYESGLSAVTSDTVCFPAKLVHGHLRNLAEKNVDRIFFPSISTVPSENQEKTSESMCAVVKGYPFVIRNSDDFLKEAGIPLDAPLFHWYSDEDRTDQLVHYMQQTYGISAALTRAAITAGDKAQQTFRREMQQAGQKVLDEVTRTGQYAVVLASRPYQTDTLVNHDLPAMLTGFGVPVLTVDSLPGLDDVPLDASALDIVNNYHARMLESAVITARNPHLEYIQIVSFGCGHDAYLSDEITRLLREIAGRTPLILKLDESDVQGPLRIRVRSFLETLNMRRAAGLSAEIHPLPDPYPV